MAGHSKWANIQHRKGAQDRKRGKLFTKLIREITVAARTGGADAASNPRLRRSIDDALTANMTKDTIERAIKRGTGAIEGAAFEEVRYEGYAPGGVAVMVDCMTDNRTRTVADVRHAFSKHGGNLGADGSVAYLFAELGVIGFAPGADESRILELALESGAEDVVVGDDGSVEVLTSADAFQAVRDRFASAGFLPVSAEVTMRPSTSVALSKGEAESVIELLEELDDLDDVQRVYANADFPEEVLADV